jgi:DNA-directed RNA polymerase specialized sigma24 family protein
VAVNEARRISRSQRRIAISEIALAHAGESPGGLDPAERISIVDLRNALSRLSDEDRALLAMRYVCGFDATELGIATGRSASGTRARLSRLLDRLERDLTGEVRNG